MPRQRGDVRVVGKTGVIVQLGGFNRGANVVREPGKYVRKLLARPAVIDKVAQHQLFSLGAQQAPDIVQALLPASGLKVRGGQAENHAAEVRQRR